MKEDDLQAYWSRREVTISIGCLYSIWRFRSTSYVETMYEVVHGADLRYGFETKMWLDLPERDSLIPRRYKETYCKIVNTNLKNELVTILRIDQ